MCDPVVRMVSLGPWCGDAMARLQVWDWAEQTLRIVSGDGGIVTLQDHEVTALIEWLDSVRELLAKKEATPCP